MTAPTAQPAPADKAKWYRKRWVPIFGAGLVGLVIGSSGSGGADGPTEAQLAAATDRATEAEAARNEAQAEVATAQQEAAGAKAAALQDLKAEAAEVAAAQKALDEREKKISGMEAAAEANTFDGSDGVFLVGPDIKPGTYRGTPSEDCYYARLASTDTSDIIENNNTSGPVVVTIKAGDKAFQVTRCGTFTRIGD